MKFRPLGIAKEIIQTTGLKVTYTYDDLVFIEHSPFIIQFDGKDAKNLVLFFNVECDSGEAEKLQKMLNDAAQERGFTISNGGEFEMGQKKGSEEIEIKLLPF